MTYPSDKEIIRLLHNDALDSAEKLTGKSYKDDEATSNLGFLMGIHNNILQMSHLIPIYRQAPISN